MPESSLHTQVLQRCLERMRAGDTAARDELLRGVVHQLERLARKMLRRFPNVHRWAETDDVLQSALMRLLRGLQQLEPPTSMAQFFGLAAQQMRRELLDLARHHCNPRRPDVHHVSEMEEAPDLAAPAPSEDPADIERWCHFHEEVEKLPIEEREVVSLIFYHGRQHNEVAELLQVNERTVRRRWASAMVRLHNILNPADGATSP
jgi:RNA polymerase sigma-70 factor (ECF subfamily)